MPSAGRDTRSTWVKQFNIAAAVGGEGSAPKPLSP